MRLMFAYQHSDPIWHPPSSDGGTPSAPNYIRSLAFANLILLKTQDQDNFRRAEWHKLRIEKQMSPQEVEIAIELAEQLAKELGLSAS